jgi:hypothetical protein
MKRILALDGGGIRGVFTLQVLARIEELFRDERRRPALVLRDEFDFFAGTSTGAIIATFLAWGLPVREIERLYLERGAEMFSKADLLERTLRNKYEAESIAAFFQEFFHEDDAARTPALLGTRRFGTGETMKHLLVVMRNATTGSAWPVCNNPHAKFNDPALPDCNLQIPLWKLLRASTAAPTFFPPEEIVLGGQSHLFVDGGITPYNNPALIAALMATLPPYRLEWPTGPDRLQLVSVGTGNVRTRLAKALARQVHKLDFLEFIAPAFLGTVGAEQDMLCRVLGDCVFGAAIDTEMGDLRGPGLLAPAEKKFSYIRYNREFSLEEIETLQRESQLAFGLDNLELIPFLQQTGTDYARASVRREHLFPAATGKAAR